MRRDAPALVDRTRRRARLAAYALGFATAMFFVEALLTVRFKLALSDAEAGRGLLSEVAADHDRYSGPLSLVHLAAVIPIAIVYLRWLVGAVESASAIGAKQSEIPNARRAVVAYFLPFIGFVRPYKHMTQLLTASDPSGLEALPEIEARATADYRQHPFVERHRSYRSPWLSAPMWWATWMAGAAAGVLALNEAGSVLPNRRWAIYDYVGRVATFSLAAQVLDAVAGVSAILIVLGVAKMQRERLLRASKLRELRRAGRAATREAQA
jgi:hypothetical protein